MQSRVRVANRALIHSFVWFGLAIQMVCCNILQLDGAYPNAANPDFWSARRERGLFRLEKLRKFSTRGAVCYKLKRMDIIKWHGEWRGKGFTIYSYNFYRMTPVSRKLQRWSEHGYKKWTGHKASIWWHRYIRFHARQKYSSMAVKRFVYIPFHKDIYNCRLIYVLTRVLLSEKKEKVVIYEYIVARWGTAQHRTLLEKQFMVTPRIFL
jgi:hypothetical protein